MKVRVIRRLVVEKSVDEVIRQFQQEEMRQHLCVRTVAGPLTSRSR